MKNMLYVLRFLNVFTAGITAGGLLMVLVAVYPSIFLPVWWPFAKVTFQNPKLAAQLHRAIDLLPDAYMRPSTIISGISAVLVLVFHRDLTRFTAAFTLVGLVGTLGIILTSEFFNVPINRTVHGWKEDYVSPEYPKMLARWGFFHVVRTSSSLLALGCYLVAVLVH